MAWQRILWCAVAAAGVGLTTAGGARAAEADGAAQDEKGASAAMAIGLQRFEQVEVQEYPWGWIRWLMNDQLDPAAEMTFGMVYIKPHQTNPLHIHPNSAEYLHVIEGSCEHRIGDRWVTVKVGDTLRIPANVKHNARTKDEACRAVIVYDTGKRQMVPVPE
jgi:quercetin dioxygenase-like cupin family protein